MGFIEDIVRDGVRSLGERKADEARQKTEQSKRQDNTKHYFNAKIEFIDKPDFDNMKRAEVVK